MSIDRRQRDIVEFIQKHKMAKVATLSKQFKVSPETIRKDLVELDEMGMLVRVHGGARINSRDRESAYSERESSYLEEKERLARVALDLIQDDSAIYLDYGTTTRTIAKALVDSGRRLTIVTNALPVADLAAKSDSIECMVLGGILRSNGGSLYGPIGENALEYLNFDMGFFSCGGVDAEAEITNHFPLEVVLSRKAMKRCERVVVVADGSKIGAIAMHRLARFEEVNALLTTENPPPGLLTALEDSNVRLVVADPQ